MESLLPLTTLPKIRAASSCPIIAANSSCADIKRAAFSLILPTPVLIVFTFNDAGGVHLVAAKALPTEPTKASVTTSPVELPE